MGLGQANQGSMTDLICSEKDMSAWGGRDVFVAAMEYRIVEAKSLAL
jgi:hypothetical protein